jgi:hypothetical protein
LLDTFLSHVFVRVGIVPSGSLSPFTVGFRYFMTEFKYCHNRKCPFKCVFDSRNSLVYYRNLKPRAYLTIDPSAQGSSPDDQATSSGSQGDSKLELFGFDSLVNILGLRRYDQSFY